MASGTLGKIHLQLRYLNNERNNPSQTGLSSLRINLRKAFQNELTPKKTAASIRRPTKKLCSSR